MHERSTLGILIRSDRGNERRNASSDILAHDYRYRACHIYAARYGQSL